MFIIGSYRTKLWRGAEPGQGRPSYHFPAEFSTHFFRSRFRMRVTHQDQDDDPDHFLLDVEEVGQLPRPAAAAAPPGIISSKYCLWSCSAAWRCSSIICEAAL